MEIVIIAAGIGYACLLISYLVGWLNLPVECDHEDTVWPGVSVILPFRNEEAGLNRTIEALLQQEYNGTCEIIAVNDHSNDNSVKGIALFADRITILDLPEGQQGKQAALHHGILHASSEIILTTDADCLTGPGWVHAMVGCALKKNAHMVTGPLYSLSNDSLWHVFQQLDLIGLMVITGGGIANGLHALSNGANFLINKTIYLQVYEDLQTEASSSGEDVFLTQTVLNTYPGSLAFCKQPQSAVYTTPQASLSAFYAQRRRWSADTFFFPQRQILWVWAFVWLVNALAIVAIPLLLTGVVSSVTVLSFLMLKFILEWITLLIGCRFAGVSKSMQWFPIAFLINIIYVTLIGLAQLLPMQNTWKGRQS